MASRSNAIGEVTRFWLQSRHGCLVGESIPVPVPYALSDIDLVAVTADGSTIPLPGEQATQPLSIGLSSLQERIPGGTEIASGTNTPDDWG